jgi:hypothetical protein
VTNLTTALAAKQATITGGATTITTSDLTASRALASNASGKVVVSTVTDTELGYVSGVTSAVQTQIDAKSGLYAQAQFGVWTTGNYYKPSIASGTLSTNPANTMYLTPIVVPNAITAIGLTTYCTTYTSGTPAVRMGIYNDVSGKPSGAPVVDGGQVTVNASATAFTVTISTALQPGRYWLAWVAQTTTYAAVFHGNNGVTTPSWTTQSNGIGAGYAQNMITYSQGAVTGALPTIGTINLANAGAWPHIRT